MAQRNDDYLGLIVAGWTMAFVLPPGGIVTGFALIERRSGHAIGMVIVSLVSIATLITLVLTL